MTSEDDAEPPDGSVPDLRRLFCMGDGEPAAIVPQEIWTSGRLVLSPTALWLPLRHSARPIELSLYSIREPARPPAYELIQVTDADDRERPGYLDFGHSIPYGLG